MGKEKKKRADWTVFLQGSMTSLWMYLSGAFVVALFMVKGVLPERALFPVVAGLCVASSLIGGLLISDRTTLGRLLASVLNAMIFAAILVLAGMVCWHEVSWSGRGWIVLLCAMVGGVLAGILVKPRGRKKKRGKVRTVRR